MPKILTINTHVKPVFQDFIKDRYWLGRSVPLTRAIDVTINGDDSTKQPDGLVRHLKNRSDLEQHLYYRFNKPVVESSSINQPVLVTGFLYHRDAPELYYTIT